ncbi:uncharacterized protein F4812DRAFT_423121 [Daldinia caldariorum]|uniref:uncharacterized protein n=1 Tax=Daldinia caldariorum TaxID=326644 RepID=UPI002007DA30|nr:uncharacterized protein F4812DRAFT_423121 [Daldinia caldariorum]KAI1469450.1 hypothetical protein F4812DRAFT_423121 [Daldinia caldariorum]
MQLTCICDDGEVIDITTAIQTQPFNVRSLLLDSLFACFPSLPDTPDFFQAEHGIREALLQFQGDKERYVRSYIINRSLDPRTEETPRASLIHSSFECGGPVALVGVFYATIDAHRNIRSRRTLDYLLKASEETRNALFYRANTVPCNPSLIPWLRRIFDRVDSDAKGLAYILSWLGTPIPIDLLSRARLPSLSWNNDGEVAGTPARLISMIQNEEKLETSIRNLEYVGLVKSSQTAIELHPRIGELLPGRPEGRMWLPKAAKIVFHMLPKYASIRPESYSKQCKELLPHMTRILNHLNGKPAVLEQIDPVQMVEACLSISYFGDRSWKMQAVAMAAQAVTTCRDNLIEKPLLLAQVNVRRFFLSLLYSEEENQSDQLTFPVVDRRSNAFAANLAIAKARRSTQLNELTAARNCLESFSILQSGSPSSLEKMQEYKVALMHARILRFEGHFQEAYRILQDLPQKGEVLTSYCAVLCELDRCDEAIRVLESCMTPTIRPKLILAHAHLLKCMHALLREESVDQISLEISDDIYNQLGRYQPSNYFEKMDHLSILMGRAIVQHMSGQIEAALDAWQKALTTSTAWLPTGYTDLIIAYSMSELETRRGNYVLADILAGHTKVLLTQTGLQHHFIGLGSLWPVIVGRWRVAHGHDPIVPLQEACN